MRLLTTLAAAIAALLDSLFGAVRALFTRDDPTTRLDDLEAQVRAEIEAVEDRPMFEHDDDQSAEPRGPKIGDGRAKMPVDVARRFMAGDNHGYSRLPRLAQAWLVLAADRGVVIEDASDLDLSAWLSGAVEHPGVPHHAVAAILRGEHPPRPASETRDAGWSPGVAPAF